MEEESQSTRSEDEVPKTDVVFPFGENRPIVRLVDSDRSRTFLEYGPEEDAMLDVTEKVEANIREGGLDG